MISSKRAGAHSYPQWGGVTPTCTLTVSPSHRDAVVRAPNELCCEFDFLSPTSVWTGITTSLFTRLVGSVPISREVAFHIILSNAIVNTFRRRDLSSDFFSCICASSYKCAPTSVPNFLLDILFDDRVRALKVSQETNMSRNPIRDY